MLDLTDSAEPRLDLLDFAESSLCSRLDFTEALDLAESFRRLAARLLPSLDLAESLPLPPKPQPFPYLGVSARVTVLFLSGLTSLES